MGSSNIRQANMRVTAFAHVLTYGAMGGRGQVGRLLSKVVKRSMYVHTCGVIASPTGEEKDPWIAS